jgi:hypothetical protein
MEKTPMSIRNRRAPSLAILLILLAFVTVTVVPDVAWARPGGSHHESNQGEVFKAGFWAKFVKLIKAHIERAIIVIPGGGSSGPVCH